MQNTKQSPSTNTCHCIDSVKSHLSQASGEIGRPVDTQTQRSPVRQNAPPSKAIDGSNIKKSPASRLLCRPVCQRRPSRLHSLLLPPLVTSNFQRPELWEHHCTHALTHMRTSTQTQNQRGLRWSCPLLKYYCIQIILYAVKLLHFSININVIKP